MTRWSGVYACVALTTAANLLLELSLTRIFSVVFYYHFAFLAISIALFGLGAGGVFSYLVAEWRGTLFGKLGWLSGLNSLVVVAAIAVVLREDPELTHGRLALVYFATAVPFFLSGAILSLALSESIARIGQVYFFDLVGAAAGCLLLVPLLDSLGGPNTALASAALFAAAAAGWHALDGRRPLAGGALTVAAIGMVAWNQVHPLLDVRSAKGERLQNEIFVRWNSFSRISVRREPGWPAPAVFIDADANTGIADMDVDLVQPGERRALLRNMGQGLPYLVRPAAKTLIVGPGGGWDVVNALLSGSKDITGVEINPIIATTIMRERFVEVSRKLYLRPEVRIVVEDGRSFTRRSREKYQVIQGTLVDTWASTAAGAFALSENNLYTTDAFHDYLTHLTEDGVLAFTRWGFEPPRESLRLVSLAIEALRRLGETEPWRHVVVIRSGTLRELSTSGAQDTVLIARKPLSAADLEHAREVLEPGRREIVYMPDRHLPNAFTELLLSPDPGLFERRYRYDITPVSDNRPFFFYTVQPRDVWTFFRFASQDPADYKINRAVPLLFGLVGVSLLATLLTLALPPLLLRSRLPRVRGLRRFLLYFVAIGAGYIMIEVALIQKFVLLLGHPTYALTVVIFSLLVSSGIGSASSGRLRWSGRAPLGASLLVALMTPALGPLIGAAAGWPLGLKAALTVLLIFPVGFLMGMPFPNGLRTLEARHKPAVRWAWSLNAAASVLGSAGAILGALNAGLAQTMLTGAALYLAAGFMLQSPRWLPLLQRIPNERSDARPKL